MVINTIIFFISVSLAISGVMMQYGRYGSQSELTAFISLMLGISLWELNNIFIDAVTSAELKLVGYNFLNTVSASVFLYSLLWFALAYSDNEQWVNRWTVGIVGAHVVILSFAFALAPEFMYGVEGLVSRGPTRIISVTFEQWVSLDRDLKVPFALYQLYAYAIQVLAGVILGRFLLQERNSLQFGQAISLGGGIGTAVAANGLMFAGVVPPDLNPTDLGFGVLAVSFAVAIFRYRLFEITTVGRQQVVDTMDDPVIMFDDCGKIVDSNPAARTLFGIESGRRGIPTDQSFAPFSEYVDRFDDVSTVETEVAIEGDNRERYFNLSISPIKDSMGTEKGGLIVAQDITELKEREQELSLMSKVQSRVLRHNIRNELQVIQGYSEQIKQTAGNEHEIAERITATVEDLLAISDKTRTAERLIKEDQNPSQLDLVEILHNIVETYQQRHPEVSFTLVCPDECSVEMASPIKLAIEYLVENAAEHNDGSSQSIDITLTDGDTAVVTISDNGPGIPEHELSVLHSGEETPLKHAKGVGLWVVQWIIDSSAADIEFETASDGTTVTIQIPKHVGPSD